MANRVLAKKHKLVLPFQFEGKEITEVTVRRLPWGKLKRADEKDRQTHIAAMATNLPIEAIDEMDAADSLAIQTLALGDNLEGFLEVKSS